MKTKWVILLRDHQRSVGKTDIYIIQKALGHSDIKTTQMYLASLGDSEVNEEVNAMFNSRWRYEKARSSGAHASYLMRSTISLAPILFLPKCLIRYKAALLKASYNSGRFFLRRLSYPVAGLIFL